MLDSQPMQYTHAIHILIKHLNLIVTHVWISLNRCIENIAVNESYYYFLVVKLHASHLYENESTIFASKVPALIWIVDTYALIKNG